MSSPEIGASTSDNSNGNGLLLYHHYSSYYSQKVIMALNEKRLKYKSRIVQLLKCEQYEPSFMYLNPKGQVPVLIDGVKVIPDSARIIDYLEDNFSNGDTPHLCPEKGSDQALMTEKLRNELYSIPIETITFGCLRYPELTTDMQIPRSLQKLMIETNAKRPEILASWAVKYPELAEHYLHKRNRILEKNIANQCIEDVLNALEALEVLLDNIEHTLESNTAEKTNWWLCSDKFTVADISLTVLLNRLQVLGLTKRYFGDGKRPYLFEYFQRVQQKSSFSVTFQSLPRIITLWTILHKNAPLLISVSVALATAIIGSILYKSRR